MMRTTLDLDERLLAEAQKAAGTKTKTATITLALRRLVEEDARRRLAALHGAVPRARAGRRRRTPG